ncbi:hypothetical protein [Streptomyces canus]|uniref:hypothetical protein n=1 Tax=Streptomyces canus TaxID=58343 RepID=UPI00324D6C82
MEALLEDLPGMTVVVAVQRFMAFAPHGTVPHAVDVGVLVDGRGKAARIVRVQLPDRLGGVVDVLDGSGGVLGDALADGLGRVLGDRALHAVGDRPGADLARGASAADEVGREGAHGLVAVGAPALADKALDQLGGVVGGVHQAAGDAGEVGGVVGRVGQVVMRASRSCPAPGRSGGRTVRTSGVI